MSLNYTTIDFETANTRRGSPCSVGLVKVRDGQVVDERYWLMRPPSMVGHFAAFNTAIHGITEHDVIGEPTWRDRYPAVMEFIGEDVVVAHNAGFDIGVIREACVFDRLPYPTLDFLCSMVLPAGSWRCRATGCRSWPRHSRSRSVTTTTLWPTPAAWQVY